MLALGRILRGGLVLTLAVGLGGWVLERVRFGGSDDAAVARVEAEVQQRVDRGTRTLRTIAAAAGAARDIVAAAPRDATSASRLFDVLEGAVSGQDDGRVGVTIYDASETPLAWAGRALDPPTPLVRPLSLLITPGPLGPRLVLVEPIFDTARRPARRVATIVVEQQLRDAATTPGVADRDLVSTSLAPVTLRFGGGAASETTAGFALKSPDGVTLVEAAVSSADLAAARSRWRQRTAAVALSVIALTLLLIVGPLVERRRQLAAPRASLTVTATIAGVLVLSRAMFRVALIPAALPDALVGPLDLLLTSLVAAALVWLAIGLLDGRRLASPRARLLHTNPRAVGQVIGAFLVCGLLDTMLLGYYERFLQSIVARTTVDILHFSLHPLDATRLGLAFGRVLLHAAAIWGAAAIIRLPRLVWRLPRGTLRHVSFVAWAGGGLLGVVFAVAAGIPLPTTPLLFALGVTAICGFAVGRARAKSRRVSQAVRLGALFLALFVPALAMYPSLSAFAVEAKENLIAASYAPQARSLRDDLQEHVRRTREEIDALPSLAQSVAPAADPETPSADRAFRLWSQTELRAHRLTSAIELYGSDGRLVSPFALNLPNGATRYLPTNCDWDLSDDVSPMGSSETHVLRASRGICVRGRLIGGVVVRAMLDYRSLPFISSQSPYLNALRPDRQLPAEGVSGRDVEFTVYGWSRAPIFASGTSVWTLPDSVFQRTAVSRAPFWDAIDRDAHRFRVYVINDRGGIYVLGYQVLTTFGHLLNLAELATLALVAFVGLVAGTTLFDAITSGAPTNARALLREVRASFYRKVFLAFWAVAIVPVVVMAFAIRTYFAGELNAGIEDAAAKTVTVAQRLVEDYATLQQRGSGALGALDDEIMVLVSRAIDEDVNLFDRARLQATSERDLFASELLSTRTPAAVYRRIVLERAPTYVSVQQVGAVGYYVAAAPVRTGGRDGVVTVPVTLRQQEIEQQIDELDRWVLLGAVLFSLLGGAFGYWMAERIADPVNRLTRATRRIARGDLNVRVASTSADELGRLVDDFNQMAADLKRQRSAFERTQRLEAWADMARQVAHDIKNPLTPIQLSAEHARRINNDRGQPLSPVLDECVTSILGQVKLLRQIATEFSSFASSPTPHPESTSLVPLIDEVVAPYRTGLSERIAIEVVADDFLPPLELDRTLFARALTNIIENALHAMPAKGRLSIAVRFKVDPGAVAGSRRAIVVQVADTGIGMDEDALAKIFEPYFSTKATGTGLGLTIAKRNVELNGGTIRVSSARGIGTVVTMTLPV